MVILQACRAAAFSLYGYFNFTKSAFLEHAKKFKHEDMEVDITGKNCIVTGSNSGIGFEAAKALAARGATVYMICRSKERGEKALSEIRTNTGNDNVYLEICDLSTPLQIKEFAQKFMSQDKALYALVNNAGLLENERKLTADGLELNFAVNVVGVFTLTELLLPSLEKAAPESRVITVSSGGMYGSPLHSDLQFNDGKFNGVMQYSRNKRLQVAITESWAEKYGNKGIGFYSMHPGWAETPGVTQSMPEFHSRLGNKLRTTEQGADTIVWLSLRPNANLRSGGFYFDRSETTKHLPGLFTMYTPNQLNPILESIRSLSGLFPSL